MDLKKLYPHILSTYFTLRIGIGIIAFLFPLLLWFGGLALKIELKTSMSAYYYSPLRNVFVGLLFAIGTFLYLYKGFSRKENIALNFAGIFALGIALAPTDPAAAIDTSLLCYIHGICSVSYFISIAYVCIWRASDTLYLITDEKRAALYNSLYKSLGIGMVIFPLTAAFLLRVQNMDHIIVFFIELTAIWTFSAYWLIKSKELHETQMDNEVLKALVQS